MVSKGRVDGNGLELCFEGLVGDGLFVFDVSTRELVVIIMTDDVAGEDAEFDGGRVEKLRHGAEGAKCEVRRGITV